MKLRGIALWITLLGCLGCGVGHAGEERADGGPKLLVNRDGDGLAVQGYDVVAYFTESRAVKGHPSHRFDFGGATYQFASEENQALFAADPEKYAPQFGGYCAYAASIDKVSPIDPLFWELQDGRLILQHNQKAWNLWHENPAGNLVKADANWPGLVKRHGE
jgi:YHS domain-containing protein